MQARTVITRKHAKALCLTSYFTGKPCSHGHISARTVSNGNCHSCLVEKGRRNRGAANDRQKEYYKKHTDREMAASERWKSDNRSQQIEYGKAYRAAHLEQARTRRKDWNTRNAEKVRITASNCKAKRRRAPGTHTLDDVRSIFSAQKGGCAYCKAALGDRYHIDHIVPIARGGANDRKNLQLLCSPCNHRKWAKMPLVWAREIGLLL